MIQRTNTASAAQESAHHETETSEIRYCSVLPMIIVLGALFNVTILLAWVLG